MPPTIDLSQGANRTVVVPAGILCTAAPPEVAQAVAEAVACTVRDGATALARVEVEHLGRDAGGHVLVGVAGTPVSVAVVDVLIGFRSTAQPAMREHHGLPPR